MGPLLAEGEKGAGGWICNPPSKAGEGRSLAKGAGVCYQQQNSAAGARMH